MWTGSKFQEYIENSSRRTPQLDYSMSPSGPRSVSDLLQSGDISRIRSEARERRTLLARVRAELPATEAERVVSASLDQDGSLVVGVDSAAWAAKLRYERDRLLGRQLQVRVVMPG